MFQSQKLSQIPDFPITFIHGVPEVPFEGFMVLKTLLDEGCKTLAKCWGKCLYFKCEVSGELTLMMYACIDQFGRLASAKFLRRMERQKIREEERVKKMELRHAKREAESKEAQRKIVEEMEALKEIAKQKIRNLPLATFEEFRISRKSKDSGNPEIQRSRDPGNPRKSKVSEFLQNYEAIKAEDKTKAEREVEELKPLVSGLGNALIEKYGFEALIDRKKFDAFKKTKRAQELMAS